MPADSASFVSAGAVMTVLVNAAGCLVAWGVLKGTVRALERRVEALEAELGTVTGLKVAVAEVKTTLAFLLEQFRDLNASIRWMREPAAPAPPRGVAGPPRRGD
jgi:hypothetical protein